MARTTTCAPDASTFSILNGRDMRQLPLIKRKAALRKLLNIVDDDALRYSEEFDDPAKLLAVVTEMGLEGIVSKLGHHLTSRARTSAGSK